MKGDGRAGRLVMADDGPAIVFERHLKHPIERVWSAITDPDEIRQWYVRTELEPRVGGHIVEHHDHVGMAMTGEVTRFDPPHVFAHTWWDARVVWELSRTQTGTRIVMTTHLGQLEGAHGALAGWHICLDILEAVLEGADPEDHAPPAGTFADGAFTATTPGRGRWTERERLEAAYQEQVSRV